MPVRVASLLLLVALTVWVLWRVLWANLPALPLPARLASQPVARAAVGALMAAVVAAGWVGALRAAIRRRARLLADRAAAAEEGLDPERVRAAAAGRQVHCPSCGKPVAVLKAEQCAYCGARFSTEVRQAMAAAREAILRDLAAGEDEDADQGRSVV
ncbi:MAG: zinc ribbon domain-containing protein [candidate division NC10 bacterium]|nr:zinc ribbon domain-containing protein [candidate division NC10 bacterium]